MSHRQFCRFSQRECPLRAHGCYAWNHAERRARRQCLSSRVLTRAGAWAVTRMQSRPAWDSTRHSISPHARPVKTTFASHHQPYGSLR
eukprot:6274187-Lingulodinium_polyedra.AAC.1